MRFWSDDFDMDLMKLFPELPELCGDLADKMLWTVGDETYGRLNHPTVWNSQGAFLWTQIPSLPRDKHGWFCLFGCVSNEPIVECTWLEWLRDQWSHHYRAVILPAKVILRPGPEREFLELMADLRGWKILSSAMRDEDRAAVVRWVKDCNNRLIEAVLSAEQTTRLSVT